MCFVCVTPFSKPITFTRYLFLRSLSRIPTTLSLNLGTTVCSSLRFVLSRPFLCEHVRLAFRLGVAPLLSRSFRSFFRSFFIARDIILQLSPFGFVWICSGMFWAIVQFSPRCAFHRVYRTKWFATCFLGSDRKVTKKCWLPSASTNATLLVIRLDTSTTNKQTVLNYEPHAFFTFAAKRRNVEWFIPESSLSRLAHHTFSHAPTHDRAT